MDLRRRPVFLFEEVVYTEGDHEVKVVYYESSKKSKNCLVIGKYPGLLECLQEAPTCSQKLTITNNSV